uniref:MBG domain-containing protein n=1 Tax=Waltera acetigignens TaxID=2981769 RepID=UPI003F81D745
MKKRVLSLFLTFVLSFSMMPMSAFAEGTGAVAEQEAQSSGDTAYVSTTGEDVSGGDAANEDASNKDTAVEAAQALIDALPEEVTAENADELQAQLMAIDEALAELSEEQAAGLDMTRYEKICAALNAPALVAEQDSGHTEADHANMIPWEETDSLPNTAGSYYLTKDVTLTAGWEPKSGIVLCLNGKSITLNAEGDVINMSANGTIFTLYDCHKSGTITHGKDSNDTTYNGCGVVVGGTFNMYGGKITGNVRTGYENGGGVFVSYGIFNMYDGEITNNSCGLSGGGVYVDRGTFNMSGGEISSNISGESGGGIELSSSIFTMTGGSISQNKAENGYYGGGIDVSYGSTFTMNGGTITGNTSCTGGGVYVGTAVENYGNNTFNMNGGTITGNTATHTGSETGGGVYVAQDGIFTVSGAAKITDNKRNEENNNVYLRPETITITGALDRDASIGVTTPSVAVVGSPVTIAKGDGYTLTDDDAARFTSDAGYYPELDGTEVKLYKNQPQKHPICGETCTHDGIHSALVWEGITELADATKAGNYYLMNSVTRTTNGSWFCNNDVNLCLNGYSITAAHDSYAIMVRNGANFTLTDCKENSGTITHGSGKTGSGVMVNNGCSFTMYGGTICGNTAADSGSGVIVNGGSRFTMYGGAITGNNTTGDVSCGGVYVISTGTFTVSGAAKIQNNWRNGTLQNGVYVQGSGTASNVGLTPDTTITIGEGLTEESRIGVSKRLPVTAADNVIMATGAAKELDYKKIFPLDVNNPYYSVIRDGAGNLSIHLHEHGWKYQLSGDGATVTAVCNDAATCPTDGGNGGSVTLKTPAADMLTYDGTAKRVTLDGSFVKDKTIPTEVKVTYNVKDGDVLEGAPVNAGTYTASITCIGADDKSVTASVDYTIEKATLTAGDFTVTSPANLVYDGEAKYATVSSTKINGNYIHVEYEDASGTLDQAIKAGTYKVLVTANGDPNYNEASQLSDPAWTFTIQKAKPVIQLTASTQTLVKNGKAVDISGWASFNNTDSGAELTYALVDEPEGITLSADNKLTAASGTTTTGFDIQITATATDNFEAPAAATIHVAVVEKQDAGVSITGAPTGKIYGDSDFVVTATKTAPDGGTWSWSSSDSDILEIVSGGNTATPTVRVKNAGAAGAILTASYSDDTYYGIANVTIIVNPKKITADMISDVPAQEYNGKDIDPVFTVRDGMATLTRGIDFNYSYSDNTNAGTATLTITGKGNYTGTVDKTFTILPRSISGAGIELDVGSFEYTGSEHMVNITAVKLPDGTVLVAGDYDTKNNSNKATDANDSIILTIEGKGNYTGMATKVWKITRIDPKPADFDVIPGLPTVQTYDGNAVAVTITAGSGIKGMGAITVKYNGSTEAPSNAGSYVVTVDVSDGGNYNARTGMVIGTLTIDKADAPKLADIKENHRFLLTGEKTVDIKNLVAGALSYTPGTASGDTGIIENFFVDANGVVKYTLTGTGVAGNTVTLPVTISSTNYEDTTVNIVITLTEKDDQVPLTITGNTTLVYGQKLTLGTTGGSGTGAVTYRIAEAGGTGEATIDADGILIPVRVGTVTIIAAKAGDADYNEVTSKPFVITITKALPTGEPKYTVITTAGRTLADAGLTLTGSNLNPADGTLEWIDDAGKELSDNTKVEVNKAYKWRFTPTDTNYNILTGEITPYPVYSIIDGANSSWTQNTDGTLAIRGNGEFTKFQRVKVDGTVIDASNYTVTEGSTIITFKADYLKTLSEGSHTFELVWTDGSASTSFTVAKNTSDDPGNDDNNKDDNNDNNGNGNDSNDGSSNTAGSDNTVVQILDGSPNTGDASGIWIALFVVSVAGLAAMLVRRKKQ